MITQISTSVPQTTEVVPLKPAVLTLREALSVPVSQDTPEMDSPAQVSQLKQYVYVYLGIDTQTLFSSVRHLIVTWTRM